MVVVDEVQDLSSIECEALVSLWFQLQRLDNSRLVLLGDLNQQMSPSGFEWEYILNLIVDKAKLYGYASYAFDPLQGFSGDEHDKLTPCRILNNNYRTTEEIAKMLSGLINSLQNGEG